jgi:hypothetical protein
MGQVVEQQQGEQGPELLKAELLGGTDAMGLIGEGLAGKRWAGDWSYCAARDPAPE